MIVDRLESMSPNGWLRLLIQGDGDVIVSIQEGFEERDKHKEPRSASVEFCTVAGGGGSPETHKALRDLAVAMARTMQTS